MKKVKCPTCNKEIVWSIDNQFRPFCSERCKIIDMGNWADGTYAIPSNEINANEINNQQTLTSEDDTITDEPGGE